MTVMGDKYNDCKNKFRSLVYNYAYNFHSVNNENVTDYQCNCDASCIFSENFVGVTYIYKQTNKRFQLYMYNIFKRNTL